MELSEYFGDWLKVIYEEDLINISKRLQILYQRFDINPEYKDIFKAFKECSYDNCKVVMLFQDPYPQKNVPNGLALANKVGTGKLSPSLETFIYSLRAYDDTKPLVSEFDITMESLEKQGILMLNSALTVRVDKPGSHADLWYNFIAKFLISLSIINPGIIYVLFGSQAQKFEKFIETTGNCVVKAQHPAYYARIDKLIPSRVFKRIDDWVAIQHNCRINWFNNKEYGRKD